MGYDRDLKWWVRAARWLVWANLACAAWSGYRGDWEFAVGTLIWAGNCVVWRRSLRAQQTTRDEMRLLEAVMRELEEAP